MARKNNILVPESREGLDQLKASVTNSSDPENAKFDVAASQGIPLNKGYNGNIKAKEAGKIGGNIGGKMVKELVKMGQHQLNKR